MIRDFLKQYLYSLHVRELSMFSAVKANSTANTVLNINILFYSMKSRGGMRKISIIGKFCVDQERKKPPRYEEAGRERQKRLRIGSRACLREARKDARLR